jgi:hypothetical protein
MGKWEFEVLMSVSHGLAALGRRSCWRQLSHSGPLQSASLAWCHIKESRWPLEGPSQSGRLALARWLRRRDDGDYIGKAAHP